MYKRFTPAYLRGEALATPRGWRERSKGWIRARTAGLKAELDPEVASAMQALAQRYDERVRAATNDLIRLHGLTGKATQEISARLMAEQQAVKQRLDPAKAGVAGAVLTGALGGLAADLASGGLTLSMGVVVGSVAGLLGAAGAAHAYNLMHGIDDGRVRWSHDFLTQRVEIAMLRYLAVAHFGRGRGDWVNGPPPGAWVELVSSLVAARSAELTALWTEAQAKDGDEAKIQEALRAELSALVNESLGRLYPGERSVLPQDAWPST